MAETEEIKSLYDNLIPYREDGDHVYVVNSADGFRYLTVAVASSGGDAGGGRMTSSQPHRLYPGLNPVSKSYVQRVEADAKRQRERSGGVLAQMIDDHTIEIVKDLSSTSVSKVSTWLMQSANIEVVCELRSHKKHGEAAHRAFKAWHDPEASDATKTLRHFWAMSTGSRKVA